MEFVVDNSLLLDKPPAGMSSILLITISDSPEQCQVTVQARPLTFYNQLADFVKTSPCMQRRVDGKKLTVEGKPSKFDNIRRRLSWLLMDAIDAGSKINIVHIGNVPHLENTMALRNNVKKWYVSKCDNILELARIRRDSLTIETKDLSGKIDY